MRVLITDGDERAALAAARALVAAGHTVHATGTTSTCLAAASRRVQYCPLKTDGLLNPAGYAAEVSDLAERLGVRVVLPVTDQSMEALLAHQAAWPANVLVPGPDLTTYRTASDKHALLKLAANAGFEIPETHVLASREDDPPEEFFPAVLKPHHSVVSLQGTHHKLAVSFVDTLSACRQALKVIPDEGSPDPPSAPSLRLRRGPVCVAVGRSRDRRVRAPPTP